MLLPYILHVRSAKDALKICLAQKFCNLLTNSPTKHDDMADVCVCKYAQSGSKEMNGFQPSICVFETSSSHSWTAAKAFQVWFGTFTASIFWCTIRFECKLWILYWFWHLASHNSAKKRDDNVRMSTNRAYLTWLCNLFPYNDIRISWSSLLRCWVWCFWAVHDIFNATDDFYQLALISTRMLCFILFLYLSPTRRVNYLPCRRAAQKQPLSEEGCCCVWAWVARWGSAP
jgi:hypothetical protein